MQSFEEIIIPNRLNLTNAIKVVEEINALPEAVAYIPDFTNLNWIEPFAMLIISQALCDLKARYPSAQVFAKTPETQACSYADWMGFFQAAQIRDSAQQAPGSETYLPLTFKKVKDLIAGSMDASDTASQIAQSLAEQLIRTNSGSLYDAVSYAFQEILRNVVEHSQSEEIGYCAQYWSRGPKANTVEIVMMDTGIGLTTSLKNNPHLDINSDKDAIMYALSPGVSGKFYEGIKADFNNPNQNSGFGLYMNYRLCNEGGDFFICSGGTGLLRKSGADNKYFETNFHGTILRLRLNALALTDTRDLLAQFRSEGEKLASSFGKGVTPSPSAMSKMLREDFLELRKPMEIGDRVFHPKFKDGTIDEHITLPTKEEGAWVKFDNGLRKKVALSALTRILE